MKKSAKVTVAFLSSVASAFMNGCGDDGDWVEAKRCVNNSNVVVEDSWCEDPARSSGRTGALIIPTTTAAAVTTPATSLAAAVMCAQSGVNYRSASQVPRGGFGATGKAFVSHGGSISS